MDFPTHSDGISEAEAAALRQEILADAAQALELTKGAVLATTALIGFALTARSSMIALLPILILTAARNAIINRKSNTLRIATYLRAFGGSHSRYEDRLWHLRQLHKATRLKGWSARPFGTAQLLNLSGYASIAAFSFLLYMTLEKVKTLPPNAELMISFAATLLVLATWFLLVRWQQQRQRKIVAHGELEEELYRRWLQAESRSQTGDEP